MRNLARTFKALSDETRLRILNILLERECCVCEVMQVLELTQSRASRHLITLTDSGFLKFRRQGLWALYSIDWEAMDRLHLDLAGFLREALKHNQAAVFDREKLAKTIRVGLIGCTAGGESCGRKN